MRISFILRRFQLIMLLHNSVMVLGSMEGAALERVCVVCELYFGAVIERICNILPSFLIFVNTPLLFQLTLKQLITDVVPRYNRPRCLLSREGLTFLRRSSISSSTVWAAV